MQRKISILLSAIVASLMLPFVANALPASYYANNSKLASGRWVKVRVAETGIQQITYEQLAEWGFDDPSRVTVHGHGGVYGFNDVLDATVPDDLPAQPTYDTGDRILFYGESNFRTSFTFVWDNLATSAIPNVERNNVADAGYYFITDSLEPQTFDEIPYNDNYGQEIDYHYCLDMIEEEVTNPFCVGQLYFGRDITSVGAVTYSFPIEDLYLDMPATSQARMGLRLIVAGAGTYPYFRINYTNESSTKNWDVALSEPNAYQHFTTNSTISRLSYAQPVLNEGTEVFNFRVGKRAGASFTYGALDFMALYYPRHNRLAANPELDLAMNILPAGTRQLVKDVTAKTLVWSTIDGAHVRPYEVKYMPETGSLAFTTDTDYGTDVYGGRAFRAVVFNPEATHKTVEFAGEIANQNLHSRPVPDFIIITSDLCTNQAERLAEIHRTHLGQDVLVLHQEEIFNEFSSGTPSLWGIRRMVKMFYDRGKKSNGTSKMQNLLMFGGGSFDNRALFPAAQVLKNAGAQLLVFATNDHDIMSYSTKSYSSDCYFGFVEDNSVPLDYPRTLQSVNVGRISAVEESKAVTAVDKILHHLTNLPTVDIAHRALVATDFGDANAHLANGEDVSNTLHQYAPGMTTIKAYCALYPREKDGQYIRNVVARALQTGVGFFTYSGHGKPDSFSELKLWSTSAIANTEYSFYPVGLLATCDAYTFDHNNNSIAEEFVFKNNGGMIAVVAACRTVYQNPNQTLNNEFAKAYAKADEKTVTGDLYRIARNQIIEQGFDAQHVENTMCYNLCGDPAVPLYAAAYNLVLSSVNGEEFDISSGKKYEIKQLTKNTVEGYVADLDNPLQPDESFNGTILLTLYECPITRKTYTHKTTRELDTPLDIDTDQDAISEVAARVVNGRFSITFTPPTVTRSGDYNRLTLYAFSDDLKNFVQTHTVNTVIKASVVPETIEDTTSPVISSLYIDTPDFVEGDVVGGSFTVYATIDPDESGVLKSSTAIGGAARIVIDNTRMVQIVGTAMRSNADGTTSIEVPVTQVNDGRHELTLYVSDNVGNSSSRSIAFTVMNAPATVELSMEEIAATVEATFNIKHTFSNEPTGRLVIEDAKGNTVFSVEECTFPYVWDLRDSDGKKVADGPYSAYAILNSGLQYATTPRCEVVVIVRE